MAHRLTFRRLAALRAAAAHSMGNIGPRIEIAPGEEDWLTAADEIAYEITGRRRAGLLHPFEAALEPGAGRLPLLPGPTGLGRRVAGSRMRGLW